MMLNLRGEHTLLKIHTTAARGNIRHTPSLMYIHGNKSRRRRETNLCPSFSLDKGLWMILILLPYYML